MTKHDGASTDADRATIARLADEVLPTLIDRLANSALGEIEVHEGDWHIRLRRPSPAPAADALPSDRPASSQASAPPPREIQRGAVTSPAVGYFATRTGIAVGANLRSGDLIGQVDVLGVQHDVVSPVDGTLRAVEVESGQAVEYGQPIARVEAEA